MSNELEKNEDIEVSVICSSCDGSGEGPHDGSTCRVCRGCGEMRNPELGEPDYDDYDGGDYHWDNPADDYIA